MTTTIKENEYEKTIKVDLTKSPSTSDEELAKFLPTKPIYHWKKFKLTFFISFFIILLLTIIRVPYCGGYIDAYVFEYTFGNAKYLIYLYLFIFLICGIFDFEFKKILISKKMVLCFLLLLFSTILIICITQQLIKDVSPFSFANFSNEIQSYTSDFYSHYVKTIANNMSYYFDQPLSSGLLGVVFGELMLLFVIILASIFALTILIIAVLILTNKTQAPLVLKVKKWIIKKLGFDEKWVVQNELAKKPEDIKTNFIKSSEIRNEAINSRSLTPPISFLTDTSIDNYLRNKLQAKHYADKITVFLKQFQTIIQYQKTITMPTFSDIIYDVENENVVTDILASQNSLLDELKINSFNIIVKNKVLHFEILNPNLSKVSLKAVFTLINDNKPDCAIVGVDSSLQPLIINIAKKSNLILAGTNGSGATMSLLILLVSLIYTNSPDDLQMIIMSAVGNKIMKHLESIPHLIRPISSESSQITQTLIYIQNELDKREALFRNNNVKNFDAYNSLNFQNKEKIKRLVITIFNFNMICKVSLQNKQLIYDILNRGQRCGVSVIMTTQNIDNEFLDHELNKVIDVKLVYKLDFEQESMSVFNNQRGIQLFGNGDGFYFDLSNQTKERFQACYMNVHEVDSIIKIIQTFYSTKAKFN